MKDMIRMSKADVVTQLTLSMSAFLDPHKHAIHNMALKVACELQQASDNQARLKTKGR